MINPYLGSDAFLRAKGFTSFNNRTVNSPKKKPIAVNILTAIATGISVFAII